MSFANRLNYALRLKNKRAVDVVKNTDISQPLMSQYMSGKIMPSNRRLQEIADYLGIPASFLTEESDYVDGFSAFEFTRSSVRIPIYPPISCGSGGFTPDDITDYVLIPESQLSKGNEYFGQFAIGDSMKGAGIEDGDLLVFQKTNLLDSGQIGCFCLDENISTCKRFLRLNGKTILMPANDSYQPITIDPINNHFVILGRLVSITKFIK